MADKSQNSQVRRDDVVAGAVGAATTGGVAAAVGHLGGAGLAIRGAAVGIPAIAVVGVPALIGGACAVGLWKIAKAMAKKQ